MAVYGIFSSRDQFGAPLDCIGYQQLTVGTAAATLTWPAGARVAECQVEAAAIRFRLNGGAPTAAVGMPAAVSDVLYVFQNDATAAQLIRSGTVDGTANIHYYK